MVAAIDYALLSDEALAYLAWQARWKATRHAYQIPPKGDWDVWAFIAGRGAGKTRTAAEWAGRMAWNHPGTRGLVAAPTSGDVRATCFEGDSGLLNVIPPELIRSYVVSPRPTIVLVNGSLIVGYAAEEPERFRGPQWHWAWHDELAAWAYLQEAWDMIQFSMRLGDHPKQIVTTTPKPRPLISRLMKNRTSLKVHMTTASSWGNRENLAPTFRKQLEEYEGTALGRQEIHGELLDPEEAGIVRRSWWKMWPAQMPLPKLETIILSLDTAFTEEARMKENSQHGMKGDPDFTAGSVWGFWKQDQGRGVDPKPCLILLDTFEERLGFPQLLQKVKKILREDRWGDEEQKPLYRPAFGPNRVEGTGLGVETILIEEKGSGISMMQMLRQEGVGVVGYNPGKATKLERLHAVSHIFQAGRVYAVESAKSPGRFRDWAEPLIGQVCTFHGKDSLPHDDLMDSATQAVRYFTNYFSIAIAIATDKTEDEVNYEARRRRRQNPYG